jgi:hypothetical protein
MDSPDRKFLIELVRLAVVELLAYVNERLESVVASGQELDQRASDAIEAADDTWRSSLELAARAGWPYGGTWRVTIAHLVHAGLLERNRQTRKLRRPPRRAPDHLGTDTDQ